MDIQFSDLIANAPHAPGVYKMYDAENNLLYVGKARDLSNRLNQYIDIQKLELHKQVMRTLVTHVEWETVATESDALIREQELIKTLKPKYNIMLTDGKMYPMLALTTGDFPRLLKFRGKISQRRDVYGPYPSVSPLMKQSKQFKKYVVCEHVPTHLCETVRAHACCIKLVVAWHHVATPTHKNTQNPCV